MLKHTEGNNFKFFALIALVATGLLILTAIIAFPTWLFYRLFFGWLGYWHMFVFMIVAEVGCLWICLARKLRERSLVIRIIEQIIFFALFILFISFLTNKIFYSPSTQGQISGELLNTDFISEAKAIEIVTMKARELGYSVEKMNVQSKIKGDEAVIYFSSKTLQLGGDLTIKLDMKNGSIADIIRGQ